MTNPIVFAQLGSRGFMAGVDLDHIVADAKRVYEEIERDEIRVVTENQVPREYEASIAYVKDETVKPFEASGAHLLIRNFERYDSWKVWMSRKSGRRVSR